ncbi:alpha/beta hydrolase [Streptomyces sp. 3N207]|uniref:alpha/beta hydrolase n=1 Tax=Streptomyces sp. 3N207 TaxID=3457417 RepID=UPI003FD5D187
MLTYQQLKDLDPEQFEQAADGWHKASSCAEEAKDRLNDAVNPKLRAGLKGQGATAASTRLKKLAESFHYAQVQCGLVRTALNGLAGELRAAKRKLTEAVADAEAVGMSVGGDGSVHYTIKDQGPLLPGGGKVQPGQTTVPFTPEMLSPEQSKAHGFADRIGDALREAGRVDHEYAQTLRRLITTATLKVTADDWADSRKDRSAVGKAADDYLDPVPKDRTPKQNAAWWKSLNEEQRADYISLYPASVGKLDGIPAEARDEANRAVFNEKRAQYQLELDNYPPEPKVRYITAGKAGSIPDSDDKAKWQQWHDRQEHLKSALNGMKRIQTRFDDTGTAGFDNYGPNKDNPGQKGLPPAYLLGFDPENNGRAIIANGNPDKADHTAVMVPGMNTTLGGINKSQIASDNLWQATSAQPGNPTVSTINWFGYDSPSGMINASNDDAAERGAPDLNRFLDGLETTQGGPGASHTTVIGHSYGSNLVGFASKTGDLGADDIIFAGSPGVGLGHADDLDAPRGHVWNEKAGNDNLVPELGRFTHGGGSDAAVPSDKDFGANRMTTHDGDHGGYWWEGSEGLRNQAYVVTGRGGRVDLED